MNHRNNLIIRGRIFSENIFLSRAFIIFPLILSLLFAAEAGERQKNLISSIKGIIYDDVFFLLHSYFMYFFFFWRSLVSMFMSSQQQKDDERWFEMATRANETADVGRDRGAEADWRRPKIPSEESKEGERLWGLSRNEK